MLIQTLSLGKKGLGKCQATLQDVSFIAAGATEAAFICPKLMARVNIIGVETPSVYCAAQILRGSLHCSNLSGSRAATEVCRGTAAREEHAFKHYSVF